MDKQQIKRYYQALIEKDPAYVGIFYACIRTTGIFCISTCHARKPKFENIEFFSEVKEALKYGYRPCKLCKPTEQAGKVPAEIQQAMMLAAKSSCRVTDTDLKSQGLAPEKVRRWFKKQYHLTFQGYQRMIRINTACQELKQGVKVTTSAFDSGYSSLSGFGYTFKKLTGKSPQHSKKLNMILLSRINTPLGPMFACSTESGICLLEFTDRRMLETEFEDLETRLRSKIILGENDHLRLLTVELEGFFSGRTKDFTVSLDTPGSAFQQAVWAALLKIPYGSTASYQDQANILQAPKAVRAVASANGHNRVAIVIPCHRVIGSDGSLTGYSGGLERKRWLLEHEMKHSRTDLLF